MTEQNEQLEGVVVSWSEKGYGILASPNADSLLRFYFHVSAIRSGTANPRRGMKAFFYDAHRELTGNRLPMAVRVDIIVDHVAEVGQETLAGVNGQAAS